MIGKFVIVRCRDAGVHMGTLMQAWDRSVLLRDARRLWSWTEAFTLNEVALRGCGEASRISEAVPEIMLLECCEVIPCTEKATANLTRSRNGA